MLLQGRRLLVLQSEPLIAVDLKALLEAEGAVVSTRCESDASYDCIVIDSSASRKPLTERLAAEGVQIVAYTGDTEAVCMKFPDAIAVRKPALREELLSGVQSALGSQHSLCV